MHTEQHCHIIHFIILQADQICYAVLCVFSYVAAGPDKRGHVRPPLSLTKPSMTQSAHETRISERESQATLRLPSPSPQVCTLPPETLVVL